MEAARLAAAPALPRRVTLVVVLVAVVAALVLRRAASRTRRCSARRRRTARCSRSAQGGPRRVRRRCPRRTGKRRRRERDAALRARRARRRARARAHDSAPAPLRDGAYSVRWSIVSDDGHREEGVLAFAIGAAAPRRTPSSAPRRRSTWNDFAASVRCSSSACSSARARRVRDARRAGRRPSAAAAARALLFFSLLPAFLGGSGMVHAAPPGTRFALVLKVAPTLSLVGGAAAALAPTVPRLLRLAGACALALLVAPTLAGHALDRDQPRVLSASSTSPTSASAAVWLGGLISLVFVSARRPTKTRRDAPRSPGSPRRSARRRDRARHDRHRRALTELSAVHQLWSTSYGRALLVKTALFVPLLGVGWLNRTRADARVRRLRRSALVEIVALVGDRRRGRGPHRARARAKASRSPGGRAARGRAPAAAPPRDAVVDARELGSLALGVAREPQRDDGDAARPRRHRRRRARGPRRRRTATPCGSGCYRAPRRGTGPRRLIGGRTLRSTSPRTAPDGPRSSRASRGSIARRARSSSTRPRIVADERADDAVHGSSRPTASRTRPRGGPAAIVIGTHRWDRAAAGAPWQPTSQTPLDVMEPYWARPTNAHLVAPNMITFLDRRIPAWFRVDLRRHAPDGLAHDRRGALHGRPLRRVRRARRSSRRPRGSAAPPRRRARGSTARPRTPRARRARRRAPRRRERERRAVAIAPAAPTSPPIANERKPARAACRLPCDDPTRADHDARRPPPRRDRAPRHAARARRRPAGATSTGRRRPGGERRRLGGALGADARSSVGAATTRPASSSLRELTERGVESSGRSAGAPASSSRSPPRATARWPPTAAPRPSSRRTSSTGVVRLRRAPPLRLRAPPRADRVGRGAPRPVSRARTARTSRSTSRRGRSSTTRSANASRALAPDARVRDRARARRRRRARRRAGSLKRGARRTDASTASTTRRVDATSSTRPAPATRSPPASSSAAPSSGSRRPRAAARSWDRCRDPRRRRRCAARDGAGRRARDDARRARLPAGRRRRGRARLRGGGARGRRGARDDRRPRRRDRRRADATASSSASTPTARKLGPRDLAAAVVQRAVGATTVGGTLAVCRAAGHPLHGDRRPRRRPPRLADAARRLGRPAGARADAGARRLVGREVAARRARDGGAARDARRAGARLAHRHAAALLRGARRAARLGARRVGGRGGARSPRALGARRRRAAARAPAGREPRRRRAADRAGARRRRGRRACTARR